MSAKSICLCFVALIVTGLLAGFQGTNVVFAQPTNPPSPCLACHEDQYYLHDSGKWYCISEAQERCVNCHAGNASAQVKQEAHIGLIANPFHDNGLRCQHCHQGQAERLARQVVSLTGYHAVAETNAYVPQALASGSFPILRSASAQTETPVWFLPVAIAMFFLWVRLVSRSRRE